MKSFSKPAPYIQAPSVHKMSTQDYRNKLEDLESAMQAVYPKNWYKIKWKYTKQHRDKLKAKAMVCQSEINECKIYISLLGG